jgi:hypothetical protein
MTAGTRVQPPTGTRAVDLLERSAARIEARGWKRGDYGPREGPNCVFGALQWEAREISGLAICAALGVASGALDRVCDGNAICWNDNVCPNRIAAADKLREAAKWLAGVESS